jgi:hypothetical protein
MVQPQSWICSYYDHLNKLVIYPRAITSGLLSRQSRELSRFLVVTLSPRVPEALLKNAKAVVSHEAKPRAMHGGGAMCSSKMNENHSGAANFRW